MFINVFYSLVRVINKIVGLPFTFSHDGEDLILMKYLSGIKNGNYIDIGSHQPVNASNTFLFYLLGWNGVCVDPLPNLNSKYRLIRGRDKFINAGLFGLRTKSQDEELNFYYYKNNRDNSTFDPNMVKILSEKYGREPSSVITVPKISVDEMMSIREEFFKENKEIHLLNLDIEGFEIDILEDLFLDKVNPWVVCVEEIGRTADDIGDGDIYKLMKKNGYILGSKTFLSSIYILNNKLKNLPSDFIKTLEL